MKQLLSLIVISLGYSSAVSAFVIDFENVPESEIATEQGPGACKSDFSLDVDGFSFVNPGNCSSLIRYLRDGSQTVALYYGEYAGETSTTMTMTKNDGGSFDLLDLIASIGTQYTSMALGYKDGIQVYSQQLTVPFSQFYEDQTLNFLDVDRVEFTSLGSTPNPFGIDELNVNVVPIPAAVWLFGSALAGLGWMRRKPAV
ncbi:MAG: VPLPA-CTERM sorting domain-containing protein [bacterium]